MKAKRMGVFFLLSLYLLIIVYHFLHDYWILGWPKYTIWGLLLVSSILWFVSSVSRFRELVAQKNVRFFAGLTMVLLGLLMVLGVINWFVATNNKVWDLTQNQSNSLSEQTLNLLKDLPDGMTLEVWTRSLARMSQGLDAERLFQNYEVAGKGKIKLVVKDPNAHPAEAQEKRIARDPTIIVRSAEGRENRVETFNDSKAEESVTNAIIQTVKGQKKIICFLSGHKELSINEKGPQGLSFLRDSLESSAYEAREVLLATHDTMPEYCEALVVAGPQSEPLEKEVQIVREFVKAGGPTLALLGPGVPEVWSKILEDHHVKVNNDVIVDPRIAMPLGVLTDKFNEELEVLGSFGEPILLRFASSLSLPVEKPGLTIRSIVSSESVTFTRQGGIKALGNSLARRSGDQGGPHVLGVLVEAEAPKEKAADGDQEASENSSSKPIRLAAMGSYVFASNSLINQYSNRDLLLTTLNYLAGDKDIVGIRPRSKSSAMLNLSVDNLLQVQGFILLCASGFLLMGLWSYRRKRAG